MGKLLSVSCTGLLDKTIDDDPKSATDIMASTMIADPIRTVLSIIPCKEGVRMGIMFLIRCGTMWMDDTLPNPIMARPNRIEQEPNLSCEGRKQEPRWTYADG